MSVGRKKLYGPMRGVKLPVSTDTAIERLLRDGETISDFLRAAAEREIASRDRAAKSAKKTPKQG